MRILPLLLTVACATTTVAPPPAETDTGTSIADTDDTDTLVETGDTGETDPVTDTDGDGILDDDDNCVEVENPGQENLDGDLFGDACDEDRDGDFIPDAHDLFPDDEFAPGRASGELLYPHTSSKVFSFEPWTSTLEELASFVGATGTALTGVTDVAIDQYGVMYAMTHSSLYICSPQDGKCWFLSNHDGSAVGLTFVYAGTVDRYDDALIAIDGEGTWTHYEIDLTTDPIEVTPSVVGGMDGYNASGDVYSMLGYGTFASVYPEGDSSSDLLVEVDPNNGTVLREIVDLDPYNSTFGLAGMLGSVYAFDASGDIIEVDALSGALLSTTSSPHTWWGAGVVTVPPPKYTTP